MVHPDWRAALGGTVAGAVAAFPMGAVMLAADAAGLMGRQPPALIVEQGLTTAGADASAGVTTTSAVVAHVAFGAAVGALYGLVSTRDVSRHPVIARGVAYGLMVYTASYVGWIPALRILPSPPHDRPGRQASMIAAHVVFGAALAALLPVFVPRRSDRATVV